MHFLQRDKGPGTQQLDVWEGWLLLPPIRSVSQNEIAEVLIHFKSMKEGGRGPGGGHRKRFQGLISNTQRAYLLDWAILNFVCRHWSSARRIPSIYFLFYSTSVERKKGINLKFHVICAICYSMKVLFTHKSIRGSASLVQRSLFTEQGHLGKLDPGQTGLSPCRCSLMGPMAEGCGSHAWRWSSCGQTHFILTCYIIPWFNCALSLYGASWNHCIYSTWDFFFLSHFH